MNAIPKKTHEYQRTHIPSTPPAHRKEPIGKVEYLEDRRRQAGTGQRGKAKGGKPNVVPFSNRTKNSLNIATKKSQQQRLQQQWQQEQRPQHRPQQQRPQQQRPQQWQQQRPQQQWQQQQRPQQQWQQQRPQQNKQRNYEPRTVGDKNIQGRKVTAAYAVKPRTYVNSYSYDIGYGGAAAIRQNGYFAFSGYGAKSTSAPVSKPGIPGFDMYANEHEESRPIAVEERAISKKGVASTILLIAVVFMMLTLLLVKYAEASNITYQNAQLENNISELQDQLDKLEVDIALKKNLSNVQERAQELGMAYPQDDQIQYVTFSSGTEQSTVNTNSLSTITEQSATESEGNSLFDDIKAFFANIGDVIQGQ